MKIQIGCDVVDLVRLERQLERARLRELLFLESERERCEKKTNPLASLGARLAAKEAFSKALGIGLFREGLNHQDIEIEDEENGKPVLRLSQKASALMSQRHFTRSDVSLSHDGNTAMAVVVLYGSAS